MIIMTMSTLMTPAVLAWRRCDVTSPRYGAAGDGVTTDTHALRLALSECDEVLLPRGRAFVSGPLNLTSNQRLDVQGTLYASQNVADFPLIAPLMGYGWGNDENCFAPDRDAHKIIIGSLRFAPVLGAFHATNVSVVGGGVIDGRGEPWWSNCTACHYPPHNDSSFCEVASRPKLLEFQFVDQRECVQSFERATLDEAPHRHAALSTICNGRG